MIIRARPKFLSVDMIDACLHDTRPERTDDYLYFNSGRAALKFFLRELTRYRQRPLNIAIQAFNCHVVLDASLEAGCKIRLVDINKDDFSISHKVIEAYSDLDVILLTHYQGIPNQEYGLICDMAKDAGILVVEDLAQTYGSTIAGIPVGTLGDAVIESYAFDKPFSCMFGGALCVNGASRLFDASFIGNLLDAYDEMPAENELTALKHLELLRFVFVNSDVDTYEPYINQHDYLLRILSTTSNIRLIKKFGRVYSASKKILDFLRNHHELITVNKMNSAKINLIERQRMHFHRIPLPEFCRSFWKADKYRDSNICWNRFSILDPERKIRNHVLETFDNKIEIGNYNWKHPLHRTYSGNRSVSISETLENSEFVSKHILNIPVWYTPDPAGN